MNNIEKIKSLVKELNIYRDEYYNKNRPSVSDTEYDRKFDELKKLEIESNFILSNSPTQTVGYEVQSKLQKVKHTTPLLSLEKTKSVDEVKKFLNNKDALAMLKYDGLTICLEYDNGELLRASTRGNGETGEDITANAKTFKNIPLKINHKGYLKIVGEGIIHFNDFEKINSKLAPEEQYSNARNLVAGSVRQLDSSICTDRQVYFYPFNVVEGLNNKTKSENFEYIKTLGFNVEYYKVENDIQTQIDFLVKKAKENFIGIDGMVFQFNDIEYSKSLGRTGHHFKDGLAFKMGDSTVETTFRGIELKTGRNGTVSITALFDSVEVDGSIISRASLHNVDIFETYELGINDTILVGKANAIIPQVYDNLDRTNTYTLPNTCPSCSNDLKIICPTNTKVLYCDNENCKSRLLQKFVHFCSKDAMNIDGLSEATLEKFIDNGWIEKFADLYNLEKYKAEILNTEGFGKRSYEKLIEAIENSRHTTLDRYLIGLGIDGIGKTASKVISKTCGGDLNKLSELCQDKNKIKQLPDFGDIMCNNLYNWFKSKNLIEYELIEKLNFIIGQSNIISNNILKEQIYVITGSLNLFNNRDEFIKFIESNGGKISNTVNIKTTALINNDVNSSSSKNITAKKLNIPIITEREIFDKVKNYNV